MFEGDFYRYRNTSIYGTVRGMVQQNRPYRYNFYIGIKGTHISSSPGTTSAFCIDKHICVRYKLHRSTGTTMENFVPVRILRACGTNLTAAPLQQYKILHRDKICTGTNTATLFLYILFHFYMIILIKRFLKAATVK